MNQQNDDHLCFESYKTIDLSHEVKTQILTITSNSGLPRMNLKQIEESNHSPIIINSENDLVSLGFLGSGTIIDPYLISGLSIHEDMQLDSRGIVINNTTSYIKIINCTVIARRSIIIENSLNIILSNVNYQGLSLGLSVRRSHNLQILNNTCLESDIHMSHTSNITFINNTCANIWVYEGINHVLAENLCINGNYVGIQISQCDNIMILDNICTNNDYGGISLSDSSNCTIANNYCSGSTHGVAFWGNCKMNQIRNNTIVKNGQGISIKGSAEENIIKDNSAVGNSFGIIIEPDSSNPFNVKFPAKNQIFKNVFQENFRQGYDSGNRNGYGYNYWADWVNKSSDKDQDGILDDPYPIEGGNNFDRYPLASKLSLSNITITSIPIPHRDIFSMNLIMIIAGSFIVVSFLLYKLKRKSV